MRRWAGAAVALALALAAGCTIHSKVRSAVRDVAGEARGVLVLFFDGLSREAFDRLLRAGALPNIKREIVDRALQVDTAVASVPSETYPNLSAMLTGLLPGHHGIPANIWLDRRLRRRESHTNIFRLFSASDFLEPSATTLFERLPPDTVALTSPIARGATVQSRNIVSVVAAYSRNDWAFLDRKTLDDVGDAYAGASAVKRLPSLVWAHLVGVDEVAHGDGVDSPTFVATLSSSDAALGRLVKRLKRRGLYDRILFVVVADHGNANYTMTADAEELVHRALYSHPAEADCGKGRCYVVAHFKRAEKHYDVADALVAVGAYRGAMVWLPANRPPEDVPSAFRTRKQKKKPVTHAPVPLKTPPRSEFAAALARMAPIELVVTRGEVPGAAEIYGHEGRALIERAEHEGDSLYSYHVVEGQDPLGYASRPEIRGALGILLPAAMWLELTIETEYPDLVVQLSEFFDSPRAPDVFISPKAGYGFHDDKAAGHGGLSRSETTVPLLFAGPGVAPGHIPYGRTVDLAPTLLRYLGVDFDPSQMDGDDLGIGRAPARRPLAEPPPEDDE